MLPLVAADLVVVVGAPGEEEFGKAFAAAAEAWEAAGKRGEATVHVVGRGPAGGGDLAQLEDLVPRLAARSGGPLWIVLIGHGTFDGREANFNLRGRDLGVVTLAGWLAEGARPIAVVNCSASSAPFLKVLSLEGRTVITATKSGSEESYARFGEYLAKAVGDAEADLDQDGATSLLEAFLAAAKGVEDFYEKEGRIATEEALLDDNGDGFGTPADWFRGVRAVKTAKEGAEPDGQRAHQLQLVPSEEERRLPEEVREKRGVLEDELFALRKRKEAMEEKLYFTELERIARALAELYESVEKDDS